MHTSGLAILFAMYSAAIAAIAGILFGLTRKKQNVADDGPLPVPNISGLPVPPPTKLIIDAWTASRNSAASADRPQTVTGTTGGPGPASMVGARRISEPASLRGGGTARATASLAAYDAVGAIACAPAMIALTDSSMFANTADLLPEGLRTLVVTPNRTVEPGMTVHAAFTLRNPGGRSANGFRVRFSLPAELAYARGSARIDDEPLPDRDGDSALLGVTGAEIGEVPAGGERRIALSFTVAETIENGTLIAIQAAFASPDVPAIGSNIVRLIVRSQPMLANAQTHVSLEPTDTVRPGTELQLTARVCNSGQSSAHDVIVMLPIPRQTTLVAHSVSIDGRPLAPDAAFGFARPSVVAPILAPGATVTVAYSVSIDSPLEDATLITAGAIACAREIAEFSLAPCTVRVASAASFDDPDSTFAVDCGEEVAPGQHVTLTLRAKNAGTAVARDVHASVILPPGMAYAAGSLSIDRALTPDRGSIPENIRLGDLVPGRVVEIRITAIVRSPLKDGLALRAVARISWSAGERSFEWGMTARSAPRFPSDYNRIDAVTPQRVNPGDRIDYTIALANMGTDVATGPRLELGAPPCLTQIRVTDGDRPLPAGEDGSFALARIEPGMTRRLAVQAVVAPVVADQTMLELVAALVTADGKRIDLGTAAHIVESLPKFVSTTSHLSADGGHELRYTHIRTIRLVLVNAGTDAAHAVRVALDLPLELHVDGVDRALHDDGSIAFGEIPAGETREAILSVKLVGIVGGGETLTVGARVSGTNVIPLNLAPIELTTRAQASFADGATLLAAPPSAVDAGAEVFYTMRVRNSGDGVAKRLAARITQLTNAVYAQGTTTVNGVALADRAGSSLLLGDGGLQLADVGAGVEVVVRWGAIVNMPLPPGTTIEATAAVDWDEAGELTVVAAPVEVRSSAALPVIDPDLPFSVLGAIAAPAVTAWPVRPA